MNPLYVIKPDLKRILIPEIIKLIFTYSLLYFAIWLNFTLLKINSVILFSILAIILLFTLIVQLFIFSSGKLKVEYQIYPSLIYKTGPKQLTLQFYQIRNLYLKRNILDKPFNTSSIVLTPLFIIENIHNGEQLHRYLLQTMGRYQ